MPEFENFEQAAAALAGEPIPTNTPEAPAPVEGTPAPADPTNDLSALTPEELRNGYLRQQDYTRKTQEIAPLRTFMETAGADFERVQQAYEFVNRLNANPVETFQSLQQSLQQAGLLEGAPVQEQQQGQEEWSDEDALPPHVQQALSKVSTLEAKLAAIEQAEQNRALEIAFTRQENEIREAHPDYKDTDMQHLHALAFSTGGNLHAANQLYQQIQQNVLQGYIAQKSAVPASAPNGTSANSIVPNEAPRTLEDAHKLALEHLAATLG